jgi:hypothetical protein
MLVVTNGESLNMSTPGRRARRSLKTVANRGTLSNPIWAEHAPGTLKRGVGKYWSSGMHVQDFQFSSLLLENLL